MPNAQLVLGGFLDDNVKGDSQTVSVVDSAPDIENLEILALLGRGGMSCVYKGRQKLQDRVVAVKVLSVAVVSSESSIKRFQNEARLTANLTHPNIVKTISSGLSKDGQPYLIMEFLDGISLAEDFKRNGRFSIQKFKDIFLPLLSALVEAHKLGLIHRDIKPANIMLCESDAGGQTVKLVDFGIAKAFTEGDDRVQNLTASGMLVGSPVYMSPEQCEGKALDARSDLYSLSCVMYESLCGEPPFDGNSALEVMHNHCNSPAPSVSELSRKIDIRRELAELVLWGLAKEPGARPQSAAEFCTKLSSVLELVTLDRTPRLKVEETTSNNSARIRLVVACLFCVLLAMGAFVLIKHNESVIPTDSKSVIAQFERELQLKNLVAAQGLVERTLRSTNFQVLPPEEQERILYAFYELYKKAGMKDEVVDIAVIILDSILDRIGRLVQASTAHGENPRIGVADVEFLDPVCEYLYEQSLSQKQWEKLRRLFDSKLTYALVVTDDRLASTAFLRYKVDESYRKSESSRAAQIAKNDLYTLRLAVQTPKYRKFAKTIYTKLIRFGDKYHTLNRTFCAYLVMGDFYLREKKIDAATAELEAAKRLYRSFSLSDSELGEFQSFLNNYKAATGVEVKF